MSKHLYVGNLPHECTESELRAFIESSGRTLETVSIVLDRSTHRSRGFAFAEMASEEDGQRAIESLHGKQLGEREIRVGPAKVPQRRTADNKHADEDYGQSERPQGRRRR